MTTHLTGTSARPLHSNERWQRLCKLGVVCSLTACASSGGNPAGTTSGGGPAMDGAAGGPTSTLGICDAGHLLPTRLVRLASAELRDHLRRALPGTEEALIQAVDLQAEHVAKVSERSISAADFSAYYQAALSLAEAYAASSPEAAPCRVGAPVNALDAVDGCLQGVLQTTVARLYRRSLTTEEGAGLTSRFQRLLVTHDVQSSAAGVAPRANVLGSGRIPTRASATGTASCRCRSGWRARRRLEPASPHTSSATSCPSR